MKLALGRALYDPDDSSGKMFFNILATFAEFEADLIRMRTRGGMAIARAKGKLRGKQPKLSDRQQRELCRMHATGEYSISNLAEIFSVSRPTVYRTLNRCHSPYRTILPPTGIDPYYVDEIAAGRKTGRKRAIWPRYHQLDVVRRLVADVSDRGVGHRYLVQHSAGSGKSNSIAWLARLLTAIEVDGNVLFNSVVVITDRRILDRQIDDTIRQFVQEPSSVEHADDAEHLRLLLLSGKRIVTTTVQKFPFVGDVIRKSHKDRNFAIVIDEAHSGQGGNTASEMGRVLGNYTPEDGLEDYEDAVNASIESRQLLPNASYFAFTATPKNKTLELFGESRPQTDGTVKHEPFHIYSMKQAIEEEFILDVLTNYTPYRSYYELSKAVEDNPEFDSRRAQNKLRRYVEAHPETVAQKAAIMVDHFESAVRRPKKLGGEARAMVVAESVNRAIEYYFAIREHIRQDELPFDVLVRSRETVTTTATG